MKWERKTVQTMLLLKIYITEWSKDEQPDDGVEWRQDIYLSFVLLGKEEGFFGPTLLFSLSILVTAAISVLNQPAHPSSYLSK